MNKLIPVKGVGVYLDEKGNPVPVQFEVSLDPKLLKPLPKYSPGESLHTTAHRFGPVWEYVKPEKKK